MIDAAYAHGGPPLHGILRARPEDFEVDEELGFEPEGAGEHVLVRIEKRGANTEWVARELASALGLAPTAIGFSGLKDRHALTRQTFSVHLPGKPDPDWSTLAIEGVRVVEAARHPRKIKRGTHRRNAFRLRLTEVAGSRDDAARVLAAIAAHGVPNYFGEQRFGREGDNLRLAAALFKGARLGRSQRAFALSAARSWLFNRVLAQRVQASTWDQALAGEVWMLAGTHSIFGPQAIDDTITARLAAGDIDPSGPMWGAGTLRSDEVVRELELAVAEEQANLARGLEAAGLSQERRSLRLRVSSLQSEWQADDSLMLSFTLPAGSFATVVVRELCATTDG